MKMIDEKFETSKGKHRLYTARSMGSGQGFGILDRYRNMFITPSGWGRTRKECWDYLRETAAKFPKGGKTR